MNARKTQERTQNWQRAPGPFDSNGFRAQGADTQVEFRERKRVLLISDHPPTHTLIIPMILLLGKIGRSSIVVNNRFWRLFQLLNLASIDQLDPIYVALKEGDYNSSSEMARFKQTLFKALTSKPPFVVNNDQIVAKMLDALTEKNVILFPSGSTDRSARWRSGVAKLIIELVKQNKLNQPICLAKVSSATRLPELRRMTLEELLEGIGFSAAEIRPEEFESKELVSELLTKLENYYHEQFE